MSGSAQTYIFQVEDLLKSYGEQIAAERELELPQPYSSRFDRPIVAALLTFFICAPGCAAAAVFLMKADANIASVEMPESNGPAVTKSDRLPLREWGAEAASSAEARSFARASLYDPAFLAPSLIRGSLQDVSLMARTDATGSEPITSMPPAKPKREVRRAKLPDPVVEEPELEPAPPPGFFEKLFAVRFL